MVTMVTGGGASRMWAGIIEMSNPLDIENTTLTEGIFNIQIHFQ